MRYLNWDVLLFPQEGNDVKTPLQEFKTKCDVVQDSDSEIFSNSSNTTYHNTVTRGLPTVSCYVPSLAFRSPFRVSLHCWAPPEATKATTSLESKDNLVVFEAKVVIDGDCVAGLIFRPDAHWPQIIDMTGPEKDGKPGPLRFPSFQHEMLSQTWILPHQSIGRIKVVIAEGVSHGRPGSIPFEKTRNLVAFSFLHTPLHILEDSGIAWPNPGMYYQMSYPDFNPMSPHKTKRPDPESHAHSPRRGATVNQANALIKPETTVAPHSLSNGMIHPGLTMAPPNFKGYRHQAGDPFFSPYHQYDPLSGTGVPPFQRRLYHDHTRQTSSSGDVTMHDAQSRSTTSDEVMADYIRPISPISISNSYTMQKSSHLFSPKARHDLAFLMGPNGRSRSPPQNRQVSDESLRGPLMHRLFDDLDAQNEREPQFPETSQFSDMIDAMSPRKLPENRHYPYTDIKASIAAITPPAATRPSAAAQARASSYSGKNRPVAQLSNELPPTNHPQILSETARRTRGRPPIDISRQQAIAEKASHDLHATVEDPPSLVKSKKENRIRELDEEDLDQSARNRSRSSISNQEEKTEAPVPTDGNKKRRRVTSNTSPSAPLVAEEITTNIHSEATSKDEKQSGLSEKLNEMDDLTPDGVVTRAPLGTLINRA